LLEITYRTTSLKDPYGISALPQVMFPGTDIFRAMALTDAISVITEVATRQHVFENKPFEFVDKEAILLYPNNIPVDISITVQAGKAAPAIVSMQPGASLISLENVTGNFTFSQFMKESFGATQPLFTKYYYIKTLTLKNDKYCIDSVPVGTNITLQNVIIKQQNEKRDIIFSYNNAAYFNNIVQARTASYEPELNREPSNKQIFDLVHKDIGLLYALDNYFLGSENAFDQILQRSFYRNYQDLLLLLTEQEQKTLMDPNLKKAWLGKAQPPPVSKQLKDAIIANDIKTARYLVDVKKIELSDAEIAELEKTPAYAKILDELGLLVPPPPPLAEDEDQVPPPPAEELVVPQAPALQPTMAPVVQPKKEIEKRRLKSMGRL